MAEPGAAFCCQECGDEHPLWRLVRHGDVATTWACGPHLSDVALTLQRRRSTEVTEVTITHQPTARQHAAIARSFASIEKEFDAPGATGEGS